MNTEQVKSAVRWVITTFGPILISYGYVTAGTLEMLGGAVISIVPLIWSMLTHTQANAVAVVDTIAKQPNSPVKAVVTESTRAGVELANAMPGNTTVVAGTNAAVDLAKAA